MTRTQSAYEQVRDLDEDEHIPSHLEDLVRCGIRRAADAL